MLAVVFEILAVIFGTIGLFSPKLLNPKIKFTQSEVSRFAYLKNCGKIYKMSMFLCFLFNSIALFFYIGPIGLIAFITLIAIFIGCGSKIHLLSAFIGFLLYSFSSAIYNPTFLLNYIPVLGLIYAVITFLKNKSNSVGLAFLTYSAALLMLINILVVG